MATFNTTDLEFILTQIKMAETNTPPVSPHLAFGLREVAGTNNNTVPGQGAFGSSDLTFSRVGEGVFQVADTNPNTGLTTTYLATSGTVYDADPRVISNLIVDQTANNPAAVAAQEKALAALGTGYQNQLRNPAFNPLLPPSATNPEFVTNNTTTPANVDANGNLFINNVTPDNGLSAPSNEWFTFFGQFFDHGLDLVSKGGNGKVKMLLGYDDALYNKGADGISGTIDDLGADMKQGTQDDPFQNFMILTRATQVNGHEAQNTITPFVDQSQTYSSHPSHQVFLREYAPGVDGALHSTGKLLSGANGKMATWADLKANAATLGITLNDHDVGRVPLLKTDAYGNFVHDPVTGLPQMIVSLGADGLANTADDVTISGTVANPVSASLGLSTGVAFLNDIAHNANPFNDFGAAIATPDGDNIAGNAVGVYDAAHLPPADHPEWMGQNREYDDELLNAHYVAGDGRLNENIGLTAVHEIFHSEHDRLVDTTKATIQDELSKGNVSFAQNWVLSTVNLTIANGFDANGLPIHIIQANEWNGERLFQAAKFGTETQYQHLVFEEFARKIAPDIHVFGNNDIALDPAITAEFAHAVYRFGHSMLDEQVMRYQLNKGFFDTSGNQTDFKFTDGAGNLTNNPLAVGAVENAHNQLVGTPLQDANGHYIPDSIGLIAAFTNPLAYAAAGTDAAAQIIQGSTHQVSNEIDEFVTGALRNNLLGQPLDLAALNIARGRDTGIPPINELRNQIFSQTHDQSLRPYESWDDFGNYLKHPASLINFVAAYGTHQDIVNANTLIDKRTAALDLVKEARAESTVHPGYVDGTGKLTNMAFTDAGGKHTDFAYVDAAGHYTSYQYTDSTGHHTADVNAPGAVANTANAANSVTADAGTPVVDATGKLTPIANPDFVQDAADFMASHGAYVHNLTDVRAQHTTWSNGDVTGLDNVDLWVAGLAEKQNLFGGLLGSTFNYIFKSQLEHLQDGDRLYYLPRIEGTHWGSVIEDNSFSDLISRNTGAHHLPASVFLTPEYTVEASQIILRDAAGNILHNVDGSVLTTNPLTWAHNAATGAPLVSILNDGTIKFLGDENFLGNTMVLGGTEYADKLEAGHADDDTVYGDGGNDEIDGGGGNDFLFGGTGNDFIHDIVGDNVIHGDEGDDTIIAGRGDDILFGGDGNDYIETGDAGLLGDSAIGGLGNDILVGGVGVDTLEGNEGDDWLEGGANGDMLVGDVGAPTGQVPLYGGNDVLDGGAGGDVMKGFSGDDIMLGAGGFDKFEGRLGFDWASWENETNAVDVDMNRREFIPNPNAPAGDAVRDFFIETEAASGSRFDDFILGTNVSKADVFNELTNTNLIFGLDDYFDPLAGPVHFSGGNIILGGGGSDAITGGGGNDIIDGDARLHVELIGGHHAGAQILREILDDQNVGPTFAANGTQLTAGNIDTAVFSDVAANYTISIALDAAGNPRTAPNGSFVVQVVHTTVGAGATNDGTDLLFNMERVQFSDVTLDLNAVTGGFVAFTDAAPTGILTLLDAAPGGAPVAVGAATPINIGDTLSINTVVDIGTGAIVSEINDFDGALRLNGSPDAVTFSPTSQNVPVSDLNLQWQFQDIAGKGWVNIAGATGASYTVTEDHVGQQLRLQISYTDGLHFKEVVHSAPTVVTTFPAAPPVNHAPTVVGQTAANGLPDTQAMEDTVIKNMPLPLITTFKDDTTPANRLIYTATLAGTIDGVNVDGHPLANAGLVFSTIPDPANPGAILDGRITTLPNPAFNPLLPPNPVTNPAFLSSLPANFSGAIDIRVTATDAGGLSVQDTFRINVLPVNDGVAALSINGAATVGTVLTTTLGPDPDSSALHPSGPATFTWLRDGVAIFGEHAATYKLVAADIGLHIKATAAYVDGQGFHDTAISAQTNIVVDPTVPAAPIVTALTAAMTEDDATFSQNLLAGAFDPNGDAISVKAGSLVVSVTGNPDGGNRTLGAGDFTLDANGVFSLTGAGIAKFNNLAGGVTETIKVQYGVTDNGPEVPNTTPNTLTISVAGINDAPVVSAPVTASATEGNGTVTAIALANATDVDIGNVLHATGLPGVLPAGVTFNAANDTFSLNANNPAYNSLAAGVHQLVTVNYGVTDGTATTNQHVTFDITGTNDAPADIIVTATAAIASSNAPPAVAATVATLAAVDPDIGDTQTFSLVGGTGAAFFSVSGAGVITETNAVGVANGSNFTLNLRTNDGTATFDETINIQTGSNGNNNGGGSLNGTANTDIIYALSGNDTVNGAAGDDTLFGQSGNDVLTGGTGNDTLYGGTGNDNFVATTGGFGNDIIADFTDGADRIAVGNLGLTAADFAANVTAGNVVIGSDGAGGTLVTFTGQGSFDIQNVGPANISQADFNFSPTGLSLAHNTYKVTENAVGAKIDDVIVHDDAGDTHTFQISDDRFEIIDGDLVTPGEQLVLKLKDGVSLNYEAEKLINLNVSVFDSAGQGSTLNPYIFTLQVQDVNEAPTNILPKTASVSENAADGTLVATLSAIDPEGNSISYALADSADGRFYVTGNQIRVTHGSMLDYETSTAHTINVLATDNHGAQSTQTVTISLVDQAETTTVNGSDATDSLFGTNGADRVLGGGGDDFINASNGDDYIDGGAGADKMIGGGGNDTYVVDNLGDTITENGGSVDTVITTLSSYALSNDLENLTNIGSAPAFNGFGTASANVLVGNSFVDNLYGGTGDDLLSGNNGADTLYGGAGSDQIYGGNGADYLYGGSGADKIVGGIGNDTMSGGAGNDVFTFAAGFGNDRITDFDAGPPGGQDLLNLKQFGITAANFDGHVTITDVGDDTLITIDNNAAQTVRLVGIGDSTLIDKTDFALLGA